MDHRDAVEFMLEELQRPTPGVYSGREWNDAIWDTVTGAWAQRKKILPVIKKADIGVGALKLWRFGMERKSPIGYHAKDLVAGFQADAEVEVGWRNPDVSTGAMVAETFRYIMGTINKEITEYLSVSAPRILHTNGWEILIHLNSLRRRIPVLKPGQTMLMPVDPGF